MIWAAVYMCIGLLLIDSAGIKVGKNDIAGVIAFIICALVWPLWILLGFIAEVDEIKRSGRK